MSAVGLPVLGGRRNPWEKREVRSGEVLAIPKASVGTESPPTKAVYVRSDRGSGQSLGLEEAAGAWIGATTQEGPSYRALPGNSLAVAGNAVGLSSES